MLPSTTALDRTVDTGINKRTLAAYAIPTIGAGYMYILLGLYVMKFSTDILLIAPAMVGFIFSLSRIWDAVSDPLVGSLSDRTRLGFGRRRSWILASVMPLSLSFIMVFSPPASLSDTTLILWMSVSIVLFYSSITMFFIPHFSLGAEMTQKAQERNAVFGARHAAFSAGAILALFSFYILIDTENNHGAQAVRDIAKTNALYGVVLFSVLTFICIICLKEKNVGDKQVVKKAFSVYSDVLKNPHARLLLFSNFFIYLGQACIQVMTLYITQYVIGAPSWAPPIIFCYMFLSMISVPLWLNIAKRTGKLRLWRWSLYLTAVSFGSLVCLPAINSLNGKLIFIMTAIALAGLASGCESSLAPSLQSDTIDYDEYVTGERKEGSYFALWNLTNKIAIGTMIAIIGVVLEASGFTPNQEQSTTVKLSMIGLYAVVPCIGYSIGAVLMGYFKLNENTHQQIRLALESRQAAENQSL
jgi:Na+/melibiose symporter-like transporter